MFDLWKVFNQLYLFLLTSLLCSDAGHWRKRQSFNNKREKVLSVSPYSLKQSWKDKMGLALLPSQALPVGLSFLCTHSSTEAAPPISWIIPNQDRRRSWPQTTNCTTVEPLVRCPLNPRPLLLLSLSIWPDFWLVFSAGHLSGAVCPHGSCGPVPRGWGEEAPMP